MYALFKDDKIVGRWCHEVAGRVWQENLPDHPDMQVRISGDRELLNGKTPTKVDKDGSWGLAPGYEIKLIEPGTLNEDSLKNHVIDIR